MVTFSIAMSTYNGAKYLPEQLDSLLALTPAPLELIVGDDGSTDNTLSILSEFRSRSPFPVRVTRNSSRLGYGENFLQTASRCTGDWVAFCDQDDIWLPSKFSKCAEAISGGPSDLQLIVHPAIVADKDLNEISRTQWPHTGLYKRLSLPPDWLVLGFMQVFRRSLLNDIKFCNRRLSWVGVPDAHDAWICLIASVTGSVTVLDDSLAIYRRHDNNTTEAAGLSRRSFITRLRGRLRENAVIYEQKSHRFRAISDRLAELAIDPLNSSRSKELQTAATSIAAFADRMARRADISGSGSLETRARAFADLVRGGAYSSRHHWAFRKAEVALDLIRVLLPA